MPDGIKYHDDNCEACEARREVQIWRRDGAYSALLPGRCQRKQLCADNLVRAAGFNPVTQKPIEAQ